ncbi:MAG: GDSL-type esterase/lipase family protein [Verrucomicrobiota bacterium]|nr:GDSL-type esterase/lipase family protein [Verrucomicrobiota bacterium]
MRNLAFLLATLIALGQAQAAKPHALFVVGTHHYSPHETMPALASQLDVLGWKTSVLNPGYNPEKNSKGIDGLELLQEADVAIFYTRFLTLPPDQFRMIRLYLEAGKPVVGFRTSTHAFDYPKGNSLAKWNNGFGRNALGSQYFAHVQGNTSVTLAKGAGDHPILTGINLAEPIAAAGTLYLSDPAQGAQPLLRGTGQSNKPGKKTNRFGTFEIKPTMTQDVAWTWKNKWGGRVFCTTLGHKNSFENRNLLRLFINGICWAAGEKVPPAKTRILPLARLKSRAAKSKKAATRADARNKQTGEKPEPKSPELAQYALFEKTATRPPVTSPVNTRLPLKIKRGMNIAFIGNTLLDRSQDFGYLEALLHQAHPNHDLTVRNLAWPADALGLQPRPANFADTDQHLVFVKADVIFAAFGYNESFAGPDGLAKFRDDLNGYITATKAKAFNGKNGPRLVLLSPIANENIEGVHAAVNNANLRLYTEAMRDIAAKQQVGFVDLFSPTEKVMAAPEHDLTFNGCHLNDDGYRLFADTVFKAVFGIEPPVVDEEIRAAVLEKNKQFFRRFRPVNTFYYTGGRNRSYGYLDFLPAMRNFDLMSANRDQRIRDLARGKQVTTAIDDSNVRPLPPTTQSRGANRLLSPKDELGEFEVDPRFEVNLFASETDFPDLACPIQMRWDARGRLWVSCSTTYPHVYPGNEPNDKIVILEDTDGDGRADTSSVFADDLQIPLSFEFGNGGVYISEEPHFIFIKDTDGDGRADTREKLLTGFGCEDSHHALHDFAWTPDGDLIFREGIFHHSQVETPYGPVRQQNSGWFRFEPKRHRLTAFGSHQSTNPWGVTFDDWGQHMASYPIYAQAFHALDPVYPAQHPRPNGLRAYSGTCGQEFVDFPNWPKEMQGGFVKVRYKPSNRVEFHRWHESDFGYDEEYVSNIIFSRNLSFIPVDLRYGPDGAMYVCDWYNPVKGHAQYSLRDKRRDRVSGRIFRIMPKGAKPQKMPQIAGAPLGQLLDILKRREYRYRYWAKRELRDRNPARVKTALDSWVAKLDPADPRHRHHQIEAVWLYRGIGATNTQLLGELLECSDPHARAAATHQLRYWHDHFENGPVLLRKRANDPSSLVRMEAAIAASYIGTPTALDALLDTIKHPNIGHLSYAIRTALGSRTIEPLWKGNVDVVATHPELAKFMAAFDLRQKMSPNKRYSAKDAEFDTQKNLQVVKISAVKERMLYDVTRFEVQAGQPVRIDFTNPDATAHNIVIVAPGAEEEIGLAANEMAKDPKEAQRGQYVPKSKKVLHATRMVAPLSAEALRFTAPEERGDYPYICTFPGHWIIMKGVMVVK